MPSDLIDRRREESYRDSAVSVSVLSHWERMLYMMNLKELPTWSRFLMLPVDDQIKIFQAFCDQGLTDRQIAERFSERGEEVGEKTIANRRLRLNVRKIKTDTVSLLRSTTDVVATGDDASEGLRGAVEPSWNTRGVASETMNDVKDKGIGITISGSYAASDISNKLLALASLLNDPNFTVNDQPFWIEIKLIQQTKGEQ